VEAEWERKGRAAKSVDEKETGGTEIMEENSRRKRRK
jgi:hypothetical protein